MTNMPHKPHRPVDEKLFFLIFTPWPSTKILADPGLEPALVEPISFTFPAGSILGRSGIFGRLEARNEGLATRGQ